ncbi:MAG: hypothetical protein JNK82_07770 [Myxococcaceae bacterium]|nr:hypothetical protein [Myxococcaceae bacterium]
MSRCAAPLTFAMLCCACGGAELTVLESPEGLEDESVELSLDADESYARAKVGDDNSIQPVFFIPRDKTLSLAERRTLRRAFRDVVEWYRRELGTQTLNIAPFRVVNGAYTAAVYRSSAAPGGIWALAPTEIRTALGFSPWDSGHSAVVFGVGLLGWAGGDGNGSSGMAVVGVESLLRQGECFGEWWCSGDMWRGTVIHEMGHMLTLPHNTHPEGIMFFHGDYTNKRLIEHPYREKTKVKGTVFDIASP